MSIGRRKPAATIGTPKRPTSSHPRVTRKMAEALVAFLNLGLYVIPATRPRFDESGQQVGGDTLDQVEQEALTRAILETASANRWFASMIVKLTAVQSSSRLAMTVGCIGAYHLARHGKVPEGVGAMAYMTLGSLAEQEVEKPTFDVADPPADPPAEDIPPQPWGKAGTDGLAAG